MSRRRVSIGVTALLVGGGLIACGWWLQGTHDFLPALLLELGASVFLLVPLLVFEQLLSGRIEQAREATEESVSQVRDEVKETTRRLDELDLRYDERQAQARAEDTDAADAVRRDVSLKNLHELLSRASGQNAISNRGLRVQLDHVTDRVRFRAVHVVPSVGDPEPEAVIWLDLEDAVGANVGGSVIWSPGEAVEDAWQGLVEEAQRRNRYPGDGILVPGTLIGRVVDAAARALAIKSSPRGSVDVGPVIEFLGQWALTEQGLEHADDPPYSIPVERLRDDEHLDESMREKLWVDAGYTDAARLARAYFEYRRRRRLPPPLPQR